jgi:hypothetical protein
MNDLPVDSVLFLSIKQFILSMVVYNSETKYTQDRIVSGYQNYAPLSGDNNFILMNLLYTDQPIIQSENYIRVNEELKQFEQLYKQKVDYTLQIDFVGQDAYATANKFRNCINTRVGCDCLLRKYGLVVEDCRMVNNQTQDIDQRAYVTKFPVQLKLQGCEIVVMPLEKFQEVGIGLFPINY